MVARRLGKTHTKNLSMATFFFFFWKLRFGKSQCRIYFFKQYAVTISIVSCVLINRNCVLVSSPPRPEQKRDGSSVAITSGFFLRRYRFNIIVLCTRVAVYIAKKKTNKTRFRHYAGDIILWYARVAHSILLSVNTSVRNRRHERNARLSQLRDIVLFVCVQRKNK